MYKIIPESNGRKLSFSITVGLQEGYGPTGTIHEPDELLEVIEGWMQYRLANHQHFVTGILSDPKTVVYAYMYENTPVSATEPVITFSGEISNLYNQELITNIHVARETVNDLASLLGKTTNQSRVYVSLGDGTWILEKTDEV